MRVRLEGVEVYPVYTVAGPDSDSLLYDVPADLILRLTRAEEEFGECQRQLREIVNPPCSECGHPGHRHQTTTQGEFRCLGWGGPCVCTKIQPPNPNLIGA